MLAGKAVVFLLYSLATYCCVSSMEEPIITRDTYDVLQYPECDGKSVKDFECVGNTIRLEDDDRKETCQCKCKSGYPTYRDPAIEYVDKIYGYNVGTRGCAWYGIYREGCHYLHRNENLVHDNKTFPAPAILDLTTSGSITLTRQDNFNDKQTLCVEPFVRIPGQNLWKPVKDIYFDLDSLNDQKTKFKLSWTLKGNQDIYAYQGLAMKLNFSECNQPHVYCMIAKVAGTYTGDSNCKQRTVNDRCCIFPFVHNGKVYKNCASTSDMPGGTWCAVSLNTSIESGNHKWREFCSTSSTTPISRTTRPSSRRPPTIHTPPPPKKKTTTKQLKTEPHRAKSSRPTKDRLVSRRPVWPITVTVTHHTCRESSKVPPTFGARERSGGSDANAGLIVGIVFGVLVFVVIVALVGVCLRRRKSTRGKKSRPRKTISKEDLAESPYASIYSTSTPRNTRNHLNHGYQQSIELTEDQAAAVVRRSFLRDSVNSGGSHFYDTVEIGSRPGTGLSCPIYTMPEADYTLIMEQRQIKIDSHLPPVLPVMLSGTRNDPSKHLYSVLERDYDPLKHPEPTDNDTVFVEANPLYATTTRYKVGKGKRDNEGGLAEANPLYGTTTGFNRTKPPPLPPRLYEDPMEIAPAKTDPAGQGEADV